MPPESRKTLARSLGQFVGHIIHGVRTPVGGNPPGSHGIPPETVELKRETQTEQRDTPMGMVKVRRTVIEEIEVPSPAGPSAQPRAGGVA